MRVPLLALAVAFAASPIARAEEDPVRVTVVVVYATTTPSAVNPKLAALAEEVKKRDPELNGFRLIETYQKAVPLGESHTFDLPEKQTFKVTVDRPRDKENRVGLTIQPPGLGPISYGCTCGKFLPVVTPYKTKGGEHFIVAVMAK